MDGVYISELTARLELLNPPVSTPMAALTEDRKRKGLPPLEYLECYLDSPCFRDNIKIYEKELSANSDKLKLLLKECRQVIKSTEDYSKALTSFANVLGDFSFATEGSEQSDEERMLSSALPEFSSTLLLIEESRSNLITTLTHRLVKNLEKFRKENIHDCKEEKKRFDKASERFYQFMDKYLSHSQKKGAPPSEYEDQVVKEQLSYQQSSFQYVCMVQDLHAQKQYELMEPIIGYFHDITAFYHQAYFATSSHEPFVKTVQHKVQLLREVFMDCQTKRYDLKTAILSKAQNMISQHPEFKRQGHILVHEKKGTIVQTGWVRYFGQFRKNEDIGCHGELRLIPLESRGNLPRDFLEVKKCIRCRHDDVDRRFCMEFELALGSSPDDPVKKYTVQAKSKEDRQSWMDSMEGKEPIYMEMGMEQSHRANQLSEASFVFVERSIAVLEARGLEEEGMYRKPGQALRAAKLMKDSVEKGVIPDLSDEHEWETHIICSAVKFFFSKQLEEPLMTFLLHKDFLEAAKVNDATSRKDLIKTVIGQLPPANKKMLKIVIMHLNRVAALSKVNFMKPSNLGVCFGPSLMRPEIETVAAIAQVKHQNKVVEVLIENVQEMFPDEAVAQVSAEVKGAGQDEKGAGQEEEQKEDGKSPPSVEDSITSSFSRQFSASVHVTNIAADAKSVVSRSGSVPSPRIPRKGTMPAGRTKQPMHPHPQRPPPPPPDKPVSLVKQRSAVFQSPVNTKPKPKVPPLKPTLSSRSLIASPTVPDNSQQSPSNKCDSSVDSNHAMENKLRDSGTPGDPLPRNNSQPPSRGTSLTSLEEVTTSPKGEGTVSSPREEEVFTRLWNSGKRAVALYDCESEDPGELSFKKNDILLNVVESEETGWYSATLPNEVSGLVPFNYVKILQND